VSATASGAAPAPVERPDSAEGHGAGTPGPSRFGGARAVWWPAAILGTVMAGLILWQLAVPRGFYTGTDSVGVRSVVANLEAGQTL
jgi:hypothetical protein